MRRNAPKPLRGGLVQFNWRTAMNQERRAAIDHLINQVEIAASELREAHAKLESLQEEEQTAFDNLPEGLQQAERGQAMEATASALEDALGTLDNAISDVEDAARDLESALDQ